MHKLVEKARVGLLLDEPFFGSLCCRLQVVEDPTCQTAWTDGKHLGYNPAFINTLTLSECKGLMAHEVMHPALQHHTRRDNREPRAWNECCDDVINPALVKAGFTLPEGGRPGTDEDVSAEELYARLPPGQGGGGGQGDDGSHGDPGGCGEVRDAPKDAPGSEAEWKLAVQQAVNYAEAKGKGSLPEAIKRLVKEVLAPRVNWREALMMFVNTHAKNDYRWSPPNRRHVHRGLYLPSVRGESLPEIVVAVDTSGSINADELSQFMGEINGILEQFDTTAHVIYCDAAVQHYDEVTSDDVPYTPRSDDIGGGGTRFDPIWPYVEELGIQPCAAVYLTDLCSDHFGEEPPYPVLWVTTHDDEAPFGEVTKMY